MFTCCCAPAVVEDTPAKVPPSEISSKSEKMVVKVAVIFYSSYGHTYAMAQKVAAGVNSVDGCEAVLLQVAGEFAITRWALI
jgi:hypothetical protein